MKLKVASIQILSENGNYAGNKERAGILVRQAIEKGAKLLLLPEFALIGYEYSDSIWPLAEPVTGKTFEWLKEIAIENNVYIGTCIFENDGKDFYDTFILVGPGKDELWTHRKIEPASFEAFYFRRGGISECVFQTPLGRIGVSICLDSTKTHTLKALMEGRPELLLIPFSYPCLSDAFPKKSRENWVEQYRQIPFVYEKHLGIPVMTANKTGAFISKTPLTGEKVMTTDYADTSVILNGSGKILARIEKSEGVIEGEIEIAEPKQGKETAEARASRWLLPYTGFNKISMDLTFHLGSLRYRNSRKRKNTI